MSDRLETIKAKWAEHLTSDSDGAWLVAEVERWKRRFDRSEDIRVERRKQARKLRDELLILRGLALFAMPVADMDPAESEFRIARAELKRAVDGYRRHLETTE